MTPFLYPIIIQLYIILDNAVVILQLETIELVDRYIRGIGAAWGLPPKEACRNHR